MEQTSQRELRTVNPEWTVSELMAHFTKALATQDVALSLSATDLRSVPADVALLVSTSGSSGKSKLVAISAPALLASARSSNSYLGATSGNTWSLLLPLTHVAGVNVLIRSMELGTQPVDLRNTEGPYPKVNFTSIVPTQLFAALNGDHYLLEHLQSTKAVLVGGAALAEDLRTKAEAAGINIVTTYGSTETSGGCVYEGTPLAGVEVKITDQGLVAIKGPVLADTYLGDESLWQSQINDGFFITSDLGHLKDGKLVIDGRADDVIITGGENISLTAIDSLLSKKFPDIHSAAFAVEDPQWGHALHIAIASKEPSDEEISTLLEGEIGKAAKPKGFLRISEIPLMGIGKVDRLALVQLLESQLLEARSEGSH
ncbi:CaiC Acyl-CoA synthetases (AMP-forming)/AMP-acid ligases II [Candidatus Nanopelagicaceae bacterium]